MTVWMDANIFIGQFPFRSVARASVSETLSRMNSLGISGAIVSPMEAVFQEDSWAAEETLAEAISGMTQFMHFKVVNPKQPWWQRDAERAVNSLHVRGLRLCSTYHGYLVNGAEAAEVFEFTRERDLPVLVHCRMQDSRLQWLLMTPEADVSEISAVIERFPQNRLIIAGLHFSDMLALADLVNDRENVLLDTSRLKGPWRTFEKLAERLDLSRLAFGSLWPINLPECPLEQIRNADIGEPAREGILGGNLARLLRLA